MWGKGALDASGGDQEGERKRIADDVSKEIRVPSKPRCTCYLGRSRVDELRSLGKSYDISKREVWEAWEKVKANKGAPGVDGCSIEDFEKDLKNNLYKIWSASSRTGGEAVISCS